MVGSTGEGGLAAFFVFITLLRFHVKLYMTRWACGGDTLRSSLACRE